MKTRILIATSEGPSEIQSLVAEDPDVACAICLNGTTESLPITRGYNAFVRKPTGVIERLTGQRSFRMDVSGRISNGESWQLGVYLAHALKMRGELALEGEEADQLWLVTGAVSSRDESVQAVSHIQEKLDKALPHLKEARTAGSKVAFILPEANKSDLSKMPQGEVLVQPVSKADEVLKHPPKPRARMPLLLLCFVIVLIAAGAGAYWSNVFNLQTKLVSPDEATASKTKDVAADQPVIEQNLSEKAVEEVVPVVGPVDEKETEAVEAVETDQSGELTDAVALEDRIFVDFIVEQVANGKRCRNASTASQFITEQIVSDDLKVIDARSYCAARVLIGNAQAQPLTLSYEFYADQPEMLLSDSRKPQKGKKLLLPEEEFDLAVRLSPYRSGAFKLRLSLQAEGQSLTKELTFLAHDGDTYSRDESLDNAPETGSKYQ